MISDPVANVTYVLNPKTMTAHKMTMASTGNFVFSRITSGTPGVAGGRGGSDINGTTDVPLCKVPYEKLCPGKAELDKLQQAFR